MRPYLKYLRYVLRHKWFVMLACWRAYHSDVSVPRETSAWILWRGLVHDLSKLLPSEFFPYARFFYGPESKPVRDETGYYKPTDTGKEDFDFAWLLHQKRNRHHWQWWVLPEDGGGTRRMEMPHLDTIEMICDWQGASMAQGKNGATDVVAWWEKHGSKLQLQRRTRRYVIRTLRRLTGELL